MVQPSITKLKSYHQQLKNKIRKYNYYYYVLTSPLVSDAVYDKLYRQLLALESKYAAELDTLHSPTTQIGTDSTPHLGKKPHLEPMLSLANAWEAADVVRFSKRMALAGIQSMICEPKLDGIAVSLFYQHGNLRSALTRGNGIEGDDITQNIQYLANLPCQLQGHQIPAQLYLRGEVVLPLKAFAEINQILSIQQQKTFSNPRNTVAGILRQNQPPRHLLQQFHFYAYGVLASHNTEHQADLVQLQALGIPTIEHYQAVRNDPEALCDYAHQIQQMVLPYHIDGVVYKVNDLLQRKSIGSNATAPKWAIAYKTVNRVFQTQIEEITFQMGRTGTLTPVALVAPVMMDGVKITKVNLHNVHYLSINDIGVGNEVFIKRAGGVIPNIVTNISHPQQPCVIPHTCPFCGYALTILSKRLWCGAGLQCPAQAKERIAFFAAKSCFNIEGLSHQLVNLLYDHGKIQSPVELFTLTVPTLLTLPTFGEKKAYNLCQAIMRCQQIAFARFIHALGIDGVGSGAAQILAQHFPTLTALSTASMEQLRQLKGIGPESAQAVVSYFTHVAQQSYLARLLQFVVIQYG